MSPRQLPEIAPPGGAALRCAVPAILLATALLVPFRGKALTIDDTMFLLQAQHALVDPLHPSAFEAVWSEAPVPQRASRIMPTGPVMAWLLLPSAVEGGDESLAHLVQLVMLVLALLSTVALALRLGLSQAAATGAGLLLAATPAVLGMAGTAMPDVPAMALGVAGLERLLAWRQERRLHQAIFAPILLALATLTRSHLILLLGVGALLLVGDFRELAHWRRVRASAWALLAGSVLVTAVLLVATRDPQPGSLSLLGSIRAFLTYKRLPSNLVAFPIHWALALPLVIPWALLRPRELARRWRLFLGATALFVFLTWLDDPWLYAMAPVAALGAIALWDIHADAWERRDMVQLTLGLWLLASLPIVVYQHLPPKYLLASAPAAALLVARALDQRGRRFAAVIGAGTLVACASLGIAILRADSAFAELGRRAATELIAPHVAAGERVWYAGHWGFQWYAEKAGARCLTAAAPHPATGDLVVSSLRCKGQTIDLYPHRVRLASLTDDTPGGRLMSREAGAGFYANWWGLLPWAWGTDTLDEFVLWRLEQSALTLPGPPTAWRESGPEQPLAR